ncbi:MAG: hypothetical protein RSF40_11080 [Oscillospiraceae bacterium]
MINKTDCRLAAVMQRAKKIRHSQENNLIARLSFACVSLLCGFLGTIAIVSDAIPQNDITADAYGTMLLYSSAGAYVLVGLLAFVAGVAITLLCIRTSRKNKSFTSEEKNSEKPN